MVLQNITDLNIDFYDKKYILINAKQFDKNSRFLSVTCYYHRQIMPINSVEHAAYIRYRKADENGVFNECQIDRKGKILVELTEQMLASDGMCCADFVLVNKGDAKIDVNTGEVLYIDNASILSSMVFHIDASEVPIDSSQIESTYEYNGLNIALERAEAEYKEVIQLARSYAIGKAGGIRENEDVDNAKYYYEQSLVSVDNADKSEANALVSANLSKSYAVGGTGIRENENEDNSQYYYNKIVGIVNGVESGFIPMGTVTFDELANVEKATGYVYNISTDFTTDDSFREGSGKSYTAGTNVYICADGMVDCFGGASSPTATLSEVKEYLGI